MDIKEVLSWLAFLILLVVFYLYIKAVITKSEVVPSILTWIVWAIADNVIFFGMALEGSYNGVVSAAALGSFVIMLLSLKFGEFKVEPSDVLAGIGALIGLILLLFVDNTTAVVVTTIVMVCGAYPTFKKTWKSPESEDKKAWVLGTIGSVIGIMAIPSFTWIHATGPLGFVFINTIVLALIFRPKQSTV